tara:strand:+ start:766 stop:1197 length:432 start_codon:yes stop_codon:yes gene_type:complete
MKKSIYQGSIEQRYKQQARQAKQRGIEWKFTFEAWLRMWEQSGVIHLRGKGTGKYVMARRGDVGPYSPENCFICPFEQNIRDGHKTSASTRVPSEKVLNARGWTLLKGSRKRPYQVTLCSKYIGSFATQAEAEAAYKKAQEAR